MVTMLPWLPRGKGLRFGAMSILGMPLDAGILLLVAVGLGLGLEVAFVMARKRGRSESGGDAGSGRRDVGGAT